MASGYKSPPLFTESKPYSRYIDEIKMWIAITELPDTKQAVAIALSLPENEGTIREKVFSELGADKLNHKDGVKTLIAFLDTLYKKDEMSEAYEIYTDFDRFRRSNDMEEYVTEFERLYNRTKKHNMNLPESVLAFRLLEGACLDHKDRQIVLTGVDYSNAGTLFKQMAQSLKKFFGKQSMPFKSMPAENEMNIKVEPVYVAQEQEAFYTNGRYGWRGGRRRPGGQGRYSGYRGYNNRGRNQGGQNKERRSRRTPNPLGTDGMPMKCVICESIFHFARNCPDSYENIEKQQDSNTNNDVEAALFTGNKLEEMQVLVSETINSAVLDSGCSSTVTGETWMKCYLDTLSEDKLKQVIHCESDTMFKFGGGRRLKSKEKVTFPCEIAGVKCNITTDVVESDIPLLLGKPSMKAAKVKLDLENDSASIFGHQVELQCTSSGHYSVPLDSPIIPVDNTMHTLFTMEDKTTEEKEKVILKLHKQFAHPTSHRLIALLRDAGVTDKGSIDTVNEITISCEICKKYKKTPARPVVCLPLATKFNEVVAMDLKEWKKGSIYFLHLIDMATRFSLACVIKQKTPSTIINKIMTLWIGNGMGAPKKFLADNGGEFANDEFRDMAENLNIEVWNSAGLSPWQNGLCERNHAVVDDCVRKILGDNPKLDLEVALVWALNAKNSMQMVHGWSPYQLVFGSNPNLPSVLIDNPPALTGSTISEMFASHLSALHASRKAFIQSESSERIRRALRHQIRPSGVVYQSGDAVYYRRDNKWKGPGKVLGQDGKVVFVRHGSIYVRVHPCRLIKAGEEFQSIQENISAEKTQIPEPERIDEDAQSDNENLEASGSTQEIKPRENSVNQKTSTTIRNINVLPKVKDRVKYKLDGSEEWTTATVQSRGGKATGKHKGWFNVLNDEERVSKSVNFETEVAEWENINYEDDSEDEEVNVVFIPNTQHEKPGVQAAKESELENWRNFDVYEEVTDVGQSFITTRWVLTEKYKCNTVQVKARLVARGFEETDKMQSDSPTASKESLRIFLALTSTLEWKCRTIDIKAAFLQGDRINREVYLKPPKDIDCEGKLWKLKKCVYGLNDASRSWYFSVKEKLENSKCKQSEIDPAIFYWVKDGRLAGLFAMHVDDFIWSGTPEFERNVIDNIRSAFKTGKQAQGVFKYIGLKVTHDDESIKMDQHSYIETMQDIPLTCSRSSQKLEPLNKEEASQLRSAVGQLNWVANQTRPDICYDTLELSMSLKNPEVDDLLKANKVLKKLKSDEGHLRFPRFSNSTDLRLALFCDASYANLRDNVSSAGGFCVFLTGANQACCPLAWKATKIRRVVKSTLAAETLAMVDGLDMACYLGHLLSEILHQKPKENCIPIDCFTDNKSLYDNIHSTKVVSEKRLRIDIASIKQMLEKREISQIVWVESCHQVADCLTKRGASCSGLMNILRSATLP